MANNTGCRYLLCSFEDALSCGMSWKASDVVCDVDSDSVFEVFELFAVGSVVIVVGSPVIGCLNVVKKQTNKQTYAVSFKNNKIWTL